MSNTALGATNQNIGSNTNLMQKGGGINNIFDKMNPFSFESLKA